MNRLNKKCACEYGKKCWVLAAILVACGLFVGVIISYAFVITSAQKVQYGYTVAEQIHRGEITDVNQAQAQINGKRVKAGGFLSETKNILIRMGQACKAWFDWAFGVPPNAEIQKSTLLMSGK